MRKKQNAAGFPKKPAAHWFKEQDYHLQAVSPLADRPSDWIAIVSTGEHLS